MSDRIKLPDRERAYKALHARSEQLAKELAALREPCVWTWKKSSVGAVYRETACGYGVVHEPSKPVKFCPYCGHPYELVGSKENPTESHPIQEVTEDE